MSVQKSSSLIWGEAASRSVLDVIAFSYVLHGQLATGHDHTSAQGFIGN